MKKYTIAIFLIGFIISVYTQHTIKDISFENYPRVDGSTSTAPLSKIIACKFLNIEYEWINENSFWYPSVKRYEWWNPEVTDEERNKIPLYNGKIKTSQTHQAFINLIENKTDIILSARKMSNDEKKHADSLSVKLIETPIALDALIFLSNEKRGVKSLTTQQIQDIYMGKIDRWETVGGDSTALYPLIRDANSGSQELMENIAMQGMKMPWNEQQMMERIVRTMPEVFIALSMEYPQAICFSVYYYKEMMIRDNFPNIQMLAINGIEPNRQTIADRTYPYVSEVYAIIRSDLPKDDIAYILYEWFQSEDGQAIIKESGYVPINNNFKKGGKL
jgi:phosphate transport system substrate-binding protein